MTEVVSLQQHREENSPHASGWATCLACKHRWVAVAPVGMIGFDCPSCGLAKGTFEGLCVPQNAYTWHCNCGSELFNLTPDGAFCINCGIMTTNWAK